MEALIQQVIIIKLKDRNHFDIVEVYNNYWHTIDFTKNLTLSQLVTKISSLDQKFIIRHLPLPKISVWFFNSIIQMSE